MKKRTEERKRVLWEDEGEVAIRVVECFDLFVKLRRAADLAPPDQVIALMKKIDPAMLEGASVWLTMFLFDRFDREKQKIATSEKNSTAGATKTAPFTAEQYVSAKGRTQAQLAKEFDCTPKTLRKWQKAYGFSTKG